jgi:hypothetical protein
MKCDHTHPTKLALIRILNLIDTSHVYEAYRLMLRPVALVRTDVSEEPSASIIKVTRIGEPGTTLAVTSNRRTHVLHRVRRLPVTDNVHSSPILITLMMETLDTSEISVLTSVTRRNIPEVGILRNRHRGNLKSYIMCLVFTNSFRSAIATKFIRNLEFPCMIFLL